MLRQDTKLFLVDVEHLDGVCVALYVNVVAERWRQEIHRHVSVENVGDIAYSTAVSVELAHFKYVVLLASLLSE